MIESASPKSSKSGRNTELCAHSTEKRCHKVRVSAVHRNAKKPSADGEYGSPTNNNVNLSKTAIEERERKKERDKEGQRERHRGKAATKKEAYGPSSRAASTHASIVCPSQHVSGELHENENIAGRQSENSRSTLASTAKQASKHEKMEAGNET